MKMFKKGFAMLIAVLMLASMASALPIETFAADIDLTNAKLNTYTEFEYKEPWVVKTYATLVIKDANGNTKKDRYLSANSTRQIQDYNIYVLRGSYGDSTPTADSIMSNSSTTVYGRTVNSDKIIYNSTTATGKHFVRVGIDLTNDYIYQMKNPVWVVYKFTVNGQEYVSDVQDKCLYNACEDFANKDDNGLYTTYSTTKERLRAAISNLFTQEKNTYDSASSSDKASSYPAASTNMPTFGTKSSSTYTLTSTTAIRNIEPWGFKLTATVKKGTSATSLPTKYSSSNTVQDYGFVVYRDEDGDGMINGTSITSMNAATLASQDGAVIYSLVNGNISASSNTMTAYYVEGLTTDNLDQTVYSIPFVKIKSSSRGQTSYKYYQGNMASNNYVTMANSDTTSSKDMSSSIVEYAEALKEYEESIKEN